MLFVTDSIQCINWISYQESS